jgi:prevent-host-death family protein
MQYSAQVKPISQLKAHAAEILSDLAQRREPLVITQNGEARAVLMDVVSYEEIQSAMALLKLLAMGSRDIEEGRVRPLKDVVRRLRSKPVDA